MGFVGKVFYLVDTGTDLLYIGNRKSFGEL